MNVSTKPTVEIGVDDLERLRRAEDLAVVYGWCGVNREGPREQVAYELWKEWAVLAGQDFAGPKAHPDIDARVKESEEEWRTR